MGVYTKGGKHLGYVPGFYSKAIYALLEQDADPIVRVIYNVESTEVLSVMQ
ncbi:hypothetical protein ABLO26_29370 [Neobacillus sp. 179-J 1A1 HS]|uniref:hypothetical protein n=1 Tax=Neobacillus driksii TaxID=3035913 RepID=UPI0035BB9FEF